MIDKIIKPILLAFTIVVVSALVMRAYIAHASTQTDIVNSWTGSFTNYENIALGQSFIPGKNNFTGIEFSGQCHNGDNSTTTVTWYLCKGNIDQTAEFQNNYNCEAPGNSLVYSAQTILTCNSDITTTYGLWTAMPKSLQVGSNYYISWKETNPKIKYSYTASNKYADGGFTYGTFSVSDAKFSTYYETTYDPVLDMADDYTDVLVVDYNDALRFNYQYLSFKSKYYCYATSSPDFPCDIDFRFNDLAVGSNVYLYLANTENLGVATGTQIASTTITDNNLDQGYLRAPYQTSQFDGKEVRYCAFLQDPDGIEADRVFCGFTINWLSKSNIDYIAQRAKIKKYDITEACQDMDQTASSTFFYGIECGLRKVVYWAMTPSEETQLQFLNSAESLKSQFPMSVYYQAQDSLYKIDESFSSTTATSTARVPFMWAGVDTGLDLFNAHMIQDKLGNHWTSFNEFASYFIYALTLLYFVSEIFQHADRNMKE